jgi:hypothetical protein
MHFHGYNNKVDGSVMQDGTRVCLAKQQVTHGTNFSFLHDCLYFAFLHGIDSAMFIDFQAGDLHALITKPEAKSVDAPMASHYKIAMLG